MRPLPLIVLGLGVAAPAWGVGPRVRADREIRASPQEVRAAMAQVNAGRLTRYFAYWKDVAARSQRAMDRQAATPINQQRDLGAILRAIRVDAASKEGISAREIHALDLVTDTYLNAVEPRVSGDCLTGMSDEQVQARDRSRASDVAAAHQRFAKDFGSELEKLLSAHERELHDSASARSKYTVL